MPYDEKTQTTGSTTGQDTGEKAPRRESKLDPPVVGKSTNKGGNNTLRKIEQDEEQGYGK